MATPWKRLTNEQLQGANLALRFIRTSPVFRGKSLKIIEDEIVNTYKEMDSRILGEREKK